MQQAETVRRSAENPPVIINTDQIEAQSSSSS